MCIISLERALVLVAEKVGEIILSGVGGATSISVDVRPYGGILTITHPDHTFEIIGVLK